jgi:hypothetical protein
VVAKIAAFEFNVELMERETAMYQAIDKHGVCPAFLGHIIEGGRVIWFLIELVDGRAAGIQDLQGCRVMDNVQGTQALWHRDLNRHNFPVTSIDFEIAGHATTLSRRTGNSVLYGRGTKMFLG